MDTQDDLSMYNLLSNQIFHNCFGELKKISQFFCNKLVFIKTAYLFTITVQNLSYTFEIKWNVN